MVSLYPTPTTGEFKSLPVLACIYREKGVNSGGKGSWGGLCLCVTQ